MQKEQRMQVESYIKKLIKYSNNDLYIEYEITIWDFMNFIYYNKILFIDFIRYYIQLFDIIISYPLREKHFYNFLVFISYKLLIELKENKIENITEFNVLLDLYKDIIIECDCQVKITKEELEFLYNKLNKIKKETKC